MEAQIDNAPAGLTNQVNIPYSGFTPPNPMSKSSLKKKKKLEERERTRDERRKKKKEQHKRKIANRRELGLAKTPFQSRKSLLKIQEAAVANESALRVAIDLDFDDCMWPQDIAKCAKQCLRIYTISRRSDFGARIHFTGIKSDGNIHNALKKNEGFENWYAYFHFDKQHIDVFPRDEMVYLSSESENVLETVNTAHVYIIGGLVDHNHQKGKCYERAKALGLKTARLPLSEYVEMKTRSVLSTFHVYEILLRVAEGMCWQGAILNSVPARKGAKEKKVEKQERKAALRQAAYNGNKVDVSIETENFELAAACAAMRDQNFEYVRTCSHCVAARQSQCVEFIGEARVDSNSPLDIQFLDNEVAEQPIDYGEESSYNKQDTSEAMQIQSTQYEKRPGNEFDPMQN